MELRHMSDPVEQVDVLRRRTTSGLLSGASVSVNGLRSLHNLRV